MVIKLLIFLVLYLLKGELSNRELNHEAIHTEQMKEMLYIIFLYMVWY